LIRNCKQEKAWATKKNKAEHAKGVNPVNNKNSKTANNKKAETPKK